MGPFTENTKVCCILLTRVKGNALQSDRWQGPYEVLKKISPVTYTVKMPERRKKMRTIHVWAMHQWREPTLPIHSLSENSDETQDIPDYRPEEAI